MHHLILSLIVSPCRCLCLFPLVPRGLVDQSDLSWWIAIKLGPLEVCRAVIATRPASQLYTFFFSSRALYVSTTRGSSSAAAHRRLHFSAYIITFIDPPHALLHFWLLPQLLLLLVSEDSRPAKARNKHDSIDRPTNNQQPTPSFLHSCSVRFAFLSTASLSGSCLGWEARTAANSSPVQSPGLQLLMRQWKHPPSQRQPAEASRHPPRGRRPFITSTSTSTSRRHLLRLISPSTSGRVWAPPMTAARPVGCERCSLPFFPSPLPSPP